MPLISFCRALYGLLIKFIRPARNQFQRTFKLQQFMCKFNAAGILHEIRETTFSQDNFMVHIRFHLDCDKFTTHLFHIYPAILTVFFTSFSRICSSPCSPSAPPSTVFVAFYPPITVSPSFISSPSSIS